MPLTAALSVTPEAASHSSGASPSPQERAQPRWRISSLATHSRGRSKLAILRLHIHNWAYGLFLQDDWRASKNLTVNLGLRYEYSSVIKEQHNLLGNFDPNSATGLIQVGQSGVSGPYNPDHKNFAPRLGFAWDVNGRGKTVLRGGAGLVYETVNWEAMLAFNNAFGLGNVPTAATIDAAGDTAGGTITAGNLAIPPVMPQWDSGVPIFGANVSTSTAQLRSSQPAPCPIMSVDRNITTPYVWNWTLDMQQSITPNVSLEICVRGKSRLESDGHSGHQPARRWDRAGRSEPWLIQERWPCASRAPRLTTTATSMVAMNKPTGRIRSTRNFPI